MASFPAPALPGFYLPTTRAAPNEIRRFTDSRIEEAMKAQLANIEPGKTGALVLYADQKAIKGAIYGRRRGRLFGLLPPGEWSYVVTAERTWSGELTAAAAVGYTW